MNISALETLAKILQVQAFTAAAEARHMTLSAVSMQMKTLEAELGIALFDRQSRPPRLTPLGRQVAEHAATVVAARDALQSACTGEGRLRGVFQLGLIQTASVRLLPRLLMLAAEQAPDADFQVNAGLSEDLTTQVAQAQIDGAVVTKVDDDLPGLVISEITHEPMMLAAPAALATTDLEVLRQRLPFIHFRPTTGIGKLISATNRARGYRPERQMILDSIEGAMECVKLGLGYTVLPAPDVQRYASDAVLSRNVDGFYPGRDLVLVTRQNATTDRWRGELLDLLRKSARQPI